MCDRWLLWGMRVVGAIWGEARGECSSDHPILFLHKHVRGGRRGRIADRTLWRGITKQLCDWIDKKNSLLSSDVQLNVLTTLNERILWVGHSIQYHTCHTMHISTTYATNLCTEKIHEGCYGSKRLNPKFFLMALRLMYAHELQKKFLRAFSNEW